MIINYKGLVEMEINGKTVVFKFNMAAFTFFCDLQNLTLVEFSRELHNPKFSTYANFLYAGAETAYLQEGKNTNANGSRNFKQDDGSEWMNTIGIAEAGALMLKAFEAPESKNEVPLASQGA